MNYDLLLYSLAWLATSISVILFTYYAYQKLTPRQQDKAEVHLCKYILSLVISSTYIVIYHVGN